MTGITVVQLVHNVEKIKYPFPMSFYSVLPIADKFIFVVAGPHDDDTEGDVHRLASKHPEIVAVVHGSEHWGPCNDDEYTRDYFSDCVWPDKKDGLAELVQLGFDVAESEIVIQLPAEEIADEGDYRRCLATT